MIQTTRLKLEIWAERHRRPFTLMHADADVMADQGGPIVVANALEKFDRYQRAWTLHGTSRWAVEDLDGVFLGYTGVMFRDDVEHPLGAHHEIGWRFCQDAWSKGYASEAASCALKHAWETLNVSEIMSYTAPDNLRSQKVMQRLCLERDQLRDFTATYGETIGPWHGLVWVAHRPT